MFLTQKTPNKTKKTNKKSPKNKEKHGKKTLIGRIVNVFLTVLTLFFVVVLVLSFYQKITGNITGVFGVQIFRVSSGSMLPTLEVGDVLLCHPTKGDEVHANDIVIYRGEQGQMAGKIIVHRVVEEQGKNSSGQYVFTTKGDNNSTADPPIDDTQLIGKFSQKVPFLTVMFDVFLSPWGFVILLLLLLLLFGSELYNLIKIIVGPPPEEEGNSGKKI
ncbi:MAG: signal peptidase I [Oscillospiraceae bacterium]|jgi:signal peptidase|nr:signal peptidase I [Oscillospiraceae bacterium]